MVKGSHEKWESALSSERLVNEMYGNLRNAIEEGMMRPL